MSKIITVYDIIIYISENSSDIQIFGYVSFVLDLEELIVSGLNRTVQRSIQILELLHNADDGLTCKEISSLLDLPVTSTFDILKTLQACDYLEYDERSKSYRIGFKLFAIGASYLNSTDAISVAAPYTRQLMHMSNATSFFALEKKGKILYVCKTEAPTSLRTSAELGSEREMYCTGLGKAILASYTDQEVIRLTSSTEMVAYTQYTITNQYDLLKDLAETRSRGYAIDNQEGNLNVFCLACAVKDFTGRTIGAISIATMQSELTDDRINNFGTGIAQAAKEISMKLGFIGDIYS